MHELIYILFWIYAALAASSFLVSRETPTGYAWLYYFAPGAAYCAGLTMAYLTPLLSPADFISAIGAGYARFAPLWIPVIALLYNWRAESPRNSQINDSTSGV